jgi:pimeloyl-ACP methyl ester carboxylesterase
VVSFTLDSWRAGGGWFDWRGHRIFTRIEGAGDPLLVIHGFPTASWDWHRVWPALTSRFRVIAPDLIGFGLSAKPQSFDYNVLAYADLCAALLAREGVTRVKVLAHDLGDTVAQELLARHAGGALGARIERLCLLNGGLFPETHRPRPVQRLLATPLGPLVARRITFDSFADNFRRICARPLDDDELRTLWQLVAEGDGLRVMPALIGYIAERRRHRARWVGALVDSDVPIRLVCGLEDPVSGAHMVARYRELIGDADIVELDAVGHYPQLEAPERVLPAVLDFFARGSAGAGARSS